MFKGREGRMTGKIKVRDIKEKLYWEVEKFKGVIMGKKKYAACIIEEQRVSEKVDEGKK